LKIFSFHNEFKANNNHIKKTNYKKNQSNIRFGNNLINNYHTQKIIENALKFHKSEIMRVEPYKVEQYFERLGIPATFKDGNDYARKFVAYCCYHASKIFKQLGYAIPTKLKLMDMTMIDPNSRHTLGACYYRSYQYRPSIFAPVENFPIRTTVFNTFQNPATIYIGKENRQVLLNWENMFELAKHDKEIGWSSSGHFLSTFIHEFAHNLHYHKLYSKYGAPEKTEMYAFNPSVDKIINALQRKIGSFSSTVSPAIGTMIEKDVSKYGASKLPETFAEAFTEEVLNNIDPFKLRLIKNPFPMKKDNDIITQVLHETFEGLVNDGKGLI